jgi:hypothetical protein
MFDIFFLSYSEPNANKNWEALRTRFPTAKRLHGVKGIHQAHRQAARVSTTSHFWVVDGDSEIEQSFKFKNPDNLLDMSVYVYRAKNAVNDLVYGYGGVKLLPKSSTMEVELDAPDMTTSIAYYKSGHNARVWTTPEDWDIDGGFISTEGRFVVVDTIASTTHFNADEFSAWRGAFRECSKLASRAIEFNNDLESSKRLDTWCTLGKDKPFGQFVIAGALAGRKYGNTNKNKPEKLMLINDYNWLKAKFDKENK